MKLLLLLFLPVFWIGESQAKGISPKTRAELTKEWRVDPEVRKARFQRISEKAAKQVTIESRFSEELPLLQIDETIGSNPESIAEVNRGTGISDYLYQGDIILSEEQMRELEREVESGGRRKRQAAAYNKKWTDNTLYFYFEDEIYESKREKVYAAHKYIHSRTCINFVENATAENVVRVYDGDGCASAVGMRRGKQGLTLANGCDSFATAAHEFIHALGFDHEQSRSDRDQFVTLNRTNIETGELYNFMEIPSRFDENYTPYEYGSVMHYDPKAFANDSSYLAMIPKNMDYLNTMGRREVTFLDIQKLNEHYGCNANCDAQTSAKCQNGGYPNPRNCSQCNCPSGYGGDFCDQRPSGCGGILAATPEWQVNMIRLQNPFVGTKDLPSTCTHWITAPEGAKIEVELNNMLGTTCNYGCTHNGIEIKGYDQKLTNPNYCCENSLGTVVKSTLNPTPVIYSNRYGFTTFVIRYRYVDGPANPPTQPPPTGTTEAPYCEDGSSWECEWVIERDGNCDKKGLDWAVKTCPKSCGLCDYIPTRTFAPTTASPTTTTAKPPCEDKQPESCAQLSKNGITCEQLQSTMFAGFCDKTCGFCDPTTTVAPTTTKEPTTVAPCEDAQPKPCVMWFSAGRTCEELQNSRYAGLCNKSCGLCDDTPKTTVAPSTTRKTTTTVPCEDAQPKPCGMWFNAGRTCEELQNSRYAGLCNKSCGLCGSAVPTTTRTPPCEDKEPAECAAFNQQYGCDKLPPAVSQQTCAKTCGQCGAPKPTAPCVDQDPNYCARSVKNGKCDALEFKIAAAICPQSCGLCV